VHSNNSFVKNLITIYSVAHTEVDGDFLYKSYNDKSAPVTCWDHH